MTRHRRSLAWLQRAGAGAILVFWAVFWVEFDALPAHVRDFELNFIFPDLIWIVALLLAASQSLIAGDRRGLVYSAAAGGALVFLGLLDMVFNLRHGQYTVSVAAGVLNMAVNGGCVAFGLWNIREAVSADPGHEIQAERLCGVREE